MLITKDQFLHFTNRLAKCYAEQEAFHTDMRKYFDSPVFNYLQSAINGLEELLVVVAECDDEDDIFSWWINECDKDNCILTVQDTTTGDNTEYNVLTAEGLYNYLYDMYHHND
mgnify:CR=1 FL=1